jgi:hypothetical protein
MSTGNSLPIGQGIQCAMGAMGAMVGQVGMLTSTSFNEEQEKQLTQASLYLRARGCNYDLKNYWLLGTLQRVA